MFLLFRYLFIDDEVACDGGFTNDVVVPIDYFFWRNCLVLRAEITSVGTASVFLIASKNCSLVSIIVTALGGSEPMVFAGLNLSADSSTYLTLS